MNRKRIVSALRDGLEQVHETELLEVASCICSGLRSGGYVEVALEIEAAAGRAALESDGDQAP